MAAKMETITTPILDMLKIQHPVLLAGMNGVAGTLQSVDTLLCLPRTQGESLFVVFHRIPFHDGLISLCSIVMERRALTLDRSRLPTYHGESALELHVLQS